MSTQIRLLLEGAARSGYTLLVCKPKFVLAVGIYMQQTTSYLYAAFYGRGQINVNLTLPYHHRVKQFGSRSGQTFENVKCTHCCSLFRILYCVFIDKRYICNRRLFHAYHQSIKQFGSRPDQTLCLSQNCWQDIQQTTKT